MHPDPPTSTDLTVAQDALRESELRIQQALCVSRSFTFEWIPETDRVRRSESCAEILQLTGNEAVNDTGQRFFQRVHPEDRARFSSLVSGLTPTSPGYTVEYRVTCGDGRVAILEEIGQGKFDSSGKLIRVCGVTTDNTERKRAEAELRSSEQRYRRLHETMRDAFVIVDMEGRIQDGNSAYCELLGYEREELAALSYVEVTPSEWHDFEARIVAEQILPYGASDVYEKEYRRKDGSIIPVELRTCLVRDESGVPRQMWAIVRDITDRKKVELELRDADRKKDEFLATLAHELRNPLAPIRNGLQILQLVGHDSEQGRHAVEMMERQVTQMTRLIDDLMDVSRIRLGKINLRKSTMRLAEVIRNAIDAARPLIDAQGHELTVDGEPAAITVEGDQTRLSQVFANLLNNAAKYSEPGGRIRIKIEQNDDEVVVSVQDSGVGISPDHLTSIFEMFNQVGQNLEKAQGGLGIGLNIVRRLVAMHGGTVTAVSDGPGKGSEFIVRLPIVVEESVLQPLKTPLFRKSALRVLIVDDNRNNSDSLATLLNLADYRTAVAYDGEQGVEEVESFRPNVVLLDIGMPKLNGYDACRRIRAGVRGAQIVMIATTGWGQEEDRLHSSEAGFDYHLVKPIDPSALIKLLAEVMASESQSRMFSV